MSPHVARRPGHSADVHSARDRPKEPALERDPLPEAEPGRRGLRLGILVYRWAAFALTVALALIVDLARPGLTVLTLALLGAWVAFVTLIDGWDRRDVRWVDLLLSAAFLLVAPILAGPRTLAEEPFLAAAYPISTVLTWAAASGLWPGAAVAGALVVPLALSRPLNDLPYADLSAGEIAGLLAQGAYYLFAAVTIGLFARTLDRAAADLRLANEEAVRSRERAARSREREEMGRTLHDSVLQSLALVQRRGRELASRDQVPGPDVGELVRVAEDEERALRALLQREPEDAPDGTVPLRTVLRSAAFGVSEIPVSVSTVDPIWVPAGAAEEISSAVRQALENVVHHASATTVTVFGERDDTEISISVRDDGIGFDLDEEQLRAAGKLGIARSMRGRIEQLGGTMRIRTAPGRGTEVEFRIPAVSGEMNDDARSR
jgi:signal transduction histidine kinase